MAEMAMGPGAPFWITLRTWQILLLLVSLIVYFRWPWILMIVSEVAVLLILRGVFPWDERGGSFVLYQFSLDIALFFAAHIGVAAFYVKRRKVSCSIPA
jgi:hypothetical protein